MKAPKVIRIWHEDGKGNITQDLQMFINRGVPGTVQHVHITDGGIRAGNALGEISINKHVFTLTEKRPYSIAVERFYLAAEPKFYNIFDAAQGVLDYTTSGYGTINMGMCSIKIDNMKRTITLRIWEHAKIEMS